MFLNVIISLVICYLIGSIPSGLIVVKIANGKDIRNIESGRTGGTNALRAAGLVAGFATAGLDVLKGVSSAWIVGWLMPGNMWLQVFSALCVILGHNYSVFLPERDTKGRLRLRGGAGGASALGGAIALWPLSWAFILPFAVLVFLIVGYASITTMSVALIATILFTYRAAIGISPWSYVVYGILAEILLIWALRPNLARLRNGTERAVGLRAYRLKNGIKKSRILQSGPKCL
jgi:glycerol-3-phosphate acyltransferase PlsY